MLSEEQFLSKDNLNRYLELYTERIQREFGWVAWVITSRVYTKILALPYFKLEIFELKNIFYPFLRIYKWSVISSEKSLEDAFKK